MEENKESKIKNFINKFKELWANKRYRSLIKLVFYLIFFAVLFFIYEFASPDVANSPVEKNNDFENYNNYEYKINLNINDVLFDLDGKRYDNKYEFIFEDNTYSFDNSNLNTDNNFMNLNNDIINVFNYTPDLINNIIENSEIISEKKLITDNILIKEYSIKLDKYMEILDVNFDKYNEEDKIDILVSEKNDYVIKIELDLSNFYKYFEENYNKYEITINYNNINNVLDF